MELSQLYSNTFEKIVKYKHSLPIDSSTSVNTTTPKRKAQNAYGETEVCHIRQRQKIFSDIEIQTICKMYQSGDSVYKLAKDFECHRSTISAVLKRNGIEVTHRASRKPELVKRVIELYAEFKTPKEIGDIVGIGCGTVRQILKENDIYIRKSWEYPKK